MVRSIRQSLAEQYNQLNDREQKLVKIAGAVLPVVALTFVGLVFNNSLETTRQTIEEKERVLTMIGDVAPKYQARQDDEQGGAKGQTAKFSREAIDKNDVKLTSFVATHATAIGVQVDSYDESERPIGSDSSDDDEGASLFKADVTAKIRDVSMEKLLKLLERIETADKPVVIERITLTNKRREEGKIRATVIVSTFKRKQG